MGERPGVGADCKLLSVLLDSGQPSHEGDSSRKLGPARPWVVGTVASWMVILWPLVTGGTQCPRVKM